MRVDDYTNSLLVGQKVKVRWPGQTWDGVVDKVITTAESSHALVRDFNGFIRVVYLYEMEPA